MLWWALGCLGAVLAVLRLTRVHPAFAPVVALCAQSLVVLAGGMVGLLQPVAVAVVVLGIAYLVLGLVVDRARTLAQLVSPVVLATWVSGVLWAVVLHGRLFTHYDNFSHWALAPRVMVATGELPHGIDSVVSFHTYPLGGAAVAYLSSFLSGGAESAMMTGQAVWVTACVAALVGLARAGRIATALATLALTATLFCAGIAPTALLVDSLLGVLTAVLWVAVVVHRHRLEQVALCVGVLAAALVMVKNSGLLFVALVMVPVLWVVVRQRGAGRWRALWAVALPVLAQLVWTLHARRAFAGAPPSKHSMSVDGAEGPFGGKTLAEVGHVTGDLLLATLTRPEGWVVLIGLVVAVLVLHARGVMSLREGRQALIALGVVLVAYGVGTWAMYVLSMPSGEAAKLAGFARYHHTLVAVLAGLGVAAVAVLCARRSEGWPVGLGVVGLLAASVLVTQGPATLAGMGSRPLAVQAAREVGTGDLRGPVCVVSSVADGGFRFQALRYVTLDASVRRLAPQHVRSATTSRCATFVVLDEDRPALRALRSAGLTARGGAPYVVDR